MINSHSPHIYSNKSTFNATLMLVERAIHHTFIAINRHLNDTPSKRAI